MNNKVNDKDYIKLTPFKGWVLENFPFIESDFDCITNYQLLCKMVEYINNVISNQNQVQELGTELVTAYNQLLDYVNNYFENTYPELINDKLDEMAEDGTLSNLLNNYANLIKVYNTYSDLIADSSNFISGLKLKTLGYYAINDGGNAEYIVTNTADNTKYQVELSNSLYLELIVKDYVNIKKIGAYGDGTHDDAPFIRKAISYLKNNNGGTLYFPKGTYYINSGDPRGLNTSGTYSNNDYYTCFELIDNLNVIGENDNSILLYNSNRIGYNLSTLKGDVGAIFANFRVNGTENYHVNGNINFKNLKLIYTNLIDTDKDYIDGQLIRVNSPELEQFYNGTFNFNNITVENATGHQIINITGATKINCNNINIKNVGKMNNPSNTDFSAFYLNGNVCNVENCSVKCDIVSSGTAYELHSTNVYLHNNYAKNISTFTNIVGNILNYPSDYLIFDNICDNVNNFSTAWIYETRKINKLNIYNNIINLRYDLPTTTEHVFIVSNDTGGITSSTKNIDEFNFYNNKIQTNNINNVEVDNKTYSNYLFNTDNIKNINIYNNDFNNIRRGCIKLSEVTNGILEKVTIKNNNISNYGLNIPTTNRIEGIYILIPQAYLNNTNDKKIIIENNNIISNRTNTYGVYYNVRHSGVDTHTKTFILNNNINTDNEIYIFANTATTMANSILVNHTYKTPLTNMLDSLKCTDCSLGNYVVGSTIKGTLNNYPVECTFVGNSDKYKTRGYSNASPTTGGYHQKGSIFYNDNPTFTTANPYAWVCTTAGNPGTWTAFNPYNP